MPWREIADSLSAGPGRLAGTSRSRVCQPNLTVLKRSRAKSVPLTGRMMVQLAGPEVTITLPTPPRTLSQDMLHLGVPPLASSEHVYSTDAS
jgi:hypothetical protein